MPLKKSKILPFPYVFHPPMFGSYESPIKTGSDDPCLIRIKWLKSQGGEKRREQAVFDFFGKVLLPK